VDDVADAATRVPIWPVGGAHERAICFHTSVENEPLLPTRSVPVHQPACLALMRRTSFDWPGVEADDAVAELVSSALSDRHEQRERAVRADVTSPVKVS